MLIAERRRRLLEQVHDRGYVSFRELAEALDISESTVRRDLRSMVAEGLLTATRGGVGPLRASSRPSVTERTGPRAGADAAGVDGAPGPGQDVRGVAEFGVADNGARVAGPAGSRAAGPGVSAAGAGWAGAHGGFDAPGRAGAVDPVPAERDAIAAHAASLVVPGSAILLGPGRTTTTMAGYLLLIPRLTVVTNSLTVAQALFDAEQIDVVLVGGALRRSIGAVVGPNTEQALHGLRGAQVFLSGEGVTAERGLTTPNVFAAATDQALMAAGRQVVVLADHTKLGHDTMCQTVPADRIDTLVTDSAADPDVVRRLRAQGVDVQVV